LFAALILLRECDVLDFGTARTIDGKTSASDGIANHENPVEGANNDVQELKSERDWRRMGAAMVVDGKTTLGKLTLRHLTQTTMFRLSRPLLQAVKRSTGITGLAVHPNPLPELVKTYETTLSTLSAIPQTSVYRQATEALVRHKLNIVQSASGDVSAVENALNEGQIEQSLDIASDELSLAAKMIEWKACVPCRGRSPYTYAPLVGNLWRKSPSPDSGNTLDSPRRRSRNTCSHHIRMHPPKQDIV